MTGCSRFLARSVVLWGGAALCACAAGPPYALETRGGRTFLYADAPDVEIELLAPSGASLRLVGSEQAPHQPWRLEWAEHALELHQNQVPPGVLFSSAATPGGVCGVYRDPRSELDALIVLPDGRVFPGNAERWRDDPLHLREERWTGTWRGRPLECRFALIDDWLVGRELLLDGAPLAAPDPQEGPGPRLRVGGAVRVGSWPPKLYQERIESAGFACSLELEGAQARGTLRLKASGEEGPFTLTPAPAR